MSDTEQPKRKKGFACLTPEHVKQIASMGGKAAQASGKAHLWNTEEAKIAGSKGGKVTYARKRQREGLDEAIPYRLTEDAKDSLSSGK